MTQFSANLGFLWTDLSLPDAIRAAKVAGFDAVECHYPYDVAPVDVVAALGETGLSMLGLNTHRGNVARGENGLAALPGREADARAAINQAVDYATAIGARNIHVLAGIAEGEAAKQTFLANLAFACERAFDHQLTILIEPLNAFDAPGYFLRTTAQAAKIIDAVGVTNLKLMFDCYHVGRTEGDVIARLKDVFPLIGHIQFAAVPTRGVPDTGEVDYRKVFREIAALGWAKPLGAEYRPTGGTDESLDWMQSLR